MERNGIALKNVPAFRRSDDSLARLTTLLLLVIKTFSLPGRDGFAGVLGSGAREHAHQWMSRRLQPRFAHVPDGDDRIRLRTER